MHRRAVTVSSLSWLLPLCLSWLAAGCAHNKREVQFDPLTITGDLELEKLNDEELFACGTAAFAAEDFARAARCFDRLVDFHPASRHLRPATYNSGLSHEKLKQWAEARARFAALAEPTRGTGDALDASYRLAETLYHLERYDEASTILITLSKRSDLSLGKQLEARVQLGVCELESGRSDQAEATFRKALATWQGLPEQDKDQVDDYFPAQAQFFLGEIYRLHYESVQLEPNKGVDQLAKDLEYKAELLLSAQGHYLRSIRIGNGYWATAAGAQIGSLYETFHQSMVNAPAPKELNPEEIDVYRQELRKKIRVLLSKAINIYERTLEAAERIGANTPFVQKTRESLKKMKDLLLAEAEEEDEEPPAPPSKPTKPSRSSRTPKS